MKVVFFTIVYNGMPFIKRHLEVFHSLEIDWQWHIVEGLADLKNDTSWSLQFGGRVPEQAKRISPSSDGTTEYLDKILESYPDKITLYRKQDGSLWDGKLEMVSAPLINVREKALLWQVDCDEFWTKEQIETIAAEFIEHPEKTAAWYWCDYYVGPDIKICTRNCYAQNPNQEWLRTWHYKPGDRWAAHEPPTLVRALPDGSETDLGTLNPITHSQTERLGAVFRHEAYVLESQVAFKEEYYGYWGAVENWKKLQIKASETAPVLLSHYFPWVLDSTSAQRISSKKDSNQDIGRKPPMILVDGVVFQFPWLGGINRVWKSILSEWVAQGLGEYVTVLNRNNTFPGIAGINSIPFSEWREDLRHVDSVALEKMCRQTCSDVFISTYYTTPLLTPSVALHHDFIPEMLGCSDESPVWEEKKRMIWQASRHVCVSENTAKDLLALYPQIKTETVTHALLGVSETMRPASSEAIRGFREKYGVRKPYFLIVGERIGFPGGGAVEGYKNVVTFLKAFNRWNGARDHDVVMVGGGAEYEKSLRHVAPNLRPHLLRLDDVELAIAYSGAVALVYPSTYEGFGLPVAEAMACGCPVIASNSSSLPEVGGGAAIYIDPQEITDLVDVLDQIGIQEVRDSMISEGYTQAKKFQWNSISRALMEALSRSVIAEASIEAFSENQLTTIRRFDILAQASYESEKLVKRIICSYSWKVTRPMRVLQKIISQLLGKNYQNY